jgi:hypothetical protein
MPMSPPIPVLCDRCRAEGFAGDEGFGEIRDLLAFTPVPRRAHADGWREEVQRGFIAALAITGSPRRAARITGRHCNGAEQLRRARGSASFAGAWDAAIELYRERELLRMKDDLAGLAAEQEQALDRRSVILTREPAEADEEDYDDAMARIRDRLTRARRLYLMLISGDPAKRAAWKALVGPVDWKRAERLEAQDDEPFRNFGLIEEEAHPQGPNRPGAPTGLPNMRAPDMLLTAEAGLIPDIAGGKDALAPIAAELERFNAAKAAPPGEDLPPEEAEAIAAYRAQLIADGWTEDEDGNLFSPEDD